ncbi:hypothetical protein E2C01_005570 [Portunus trituberculatus]|uniref:Uncharacterized protein n=1 Tax=Portunus trituberculatus TaxID=210409 RepID=A0A5B7CWZ2_PORTR|nr:hypothetical protein [Portunus trituberculatus]
MYMAASGANGKFVMTDGVLNGVGVSNGAVGRVAFLGGVDDPQHDLVLRNNIVLIAFTGTPMASATPF